MARRTPPADACPLRVVAEAGQAQAGDSVEAYVGDDMIGAATLRAERRGGPLSGVVALRDVPALVFPALVRVVNARTGVELGIGRMLPDAAALMAAAGPPAMQAAFAGMDPEGPAFVVTLDRLARYGRAFTLRLDGGEATSATSVPNAAGGAQRLVFACGATFAGAQFALTDTASGVVALSGRFDATTLLAGAMGQLARLQREVDELRRDRDALARRVDVAVDLGRDKLLLERLDLFYLLLSERLDRAAGPPAGPIAAPPATRRFGPADIDGVGIFDVETDEVHEWRWFGPDATIALRDVAWPARRVVLYFHGFAGGGEPPSVGVSTGGASEPGRWRALDGRHALDVPIARAAAPAGGMLIVRLSFGRHQTSEADPRLLSAVFSGAEAIAEPD